MHRDRDARERSDSYARLPHNSPPALGKGRRQRQPVSGSWFTFVGIKPDIDPVRTRKKARALRALHWLASRSSEVSQLTARLRGSAATAGNLRASHERRLAEREGFEPPCRLPGKTLSRRPRYDHFGTSPLLTAAQSRLPSARRFWKNRCMSARHSSSSTPPVASIRWFRAGCSCARMTDSIAPAFGSGVP